MIWIINKYNVFIDDSFDGKQFLFLIVNFALCMRRFNQFLQNQAI